MNELISIIVPVYNTSEYIAACLKSLAAQTYDKIEIIVVDDGSDDGSGEIAKSFAAADTRFKVFRKVNGGVSSARNFGLAKASGEYVTFADADDTVGAGMVAHLASMADLAEGCIPVTPLEFSTDGESFVAQVFPAGDGVLAAADALLLQWRDAQPLLGPCAKLIPAELLRKNEIRFDEDIAMGEDRLFMARVIAASAGIFYSPEVFYHYTWRAESMCRSDINEKYLTQFEAFRRIRAFTDAMGEPMRREAVLTCMNHATVYAAAAAVDGDTGSVLERLRGEIKALYPEFAGLPGIGVKAKMRAALLGSCPWLTAKIYRTLKNRELK